MNRAAMTVPLAVLATLSLFAAGRACNNVPSMTWNEACIKSFIKPEWFKLCQDTLVNAPKTAEVTVFVLIATRQAKIKYESTLTTIDQMLGAGNLPADERTAVSACKEKYLLAHSIMASIADQMFACDFSRARQEYYDGQTAIMTCQNNLWSFQSLPLYATVSADFDLTMVAYELGALIVGK
ncbi:hypothetical protein ACP70R_003512 [Stipagrostis hirtigluma subsp. patula]